MLEPNGSEGSGNPGQGQGSGQGQSQSQGQSQGNSQYTPSPMVIPEPYRAEKSLQSYKTHDDFVKSHVELTKKLGTAVWLPGEKDDPASKAEKMAHIYKALGRPDAVEGYDATSLNIAPEVGFTGEHLNQLQNFAHANNFSQSQFEAAAKFVLDLHTDGVEQLRIMTKADEQTMIKEWGEATFKHRSQLAHAAINKLGGQKAAQALSERGLGSNPDLVQIFAKIGEQMLEDNAITSGDVGGGLSKAEAQAKINQVMSNPSDLYHRKFSGKPGHRERVDEVSSWFSIVHA